MSFVVTNNKKGEKYFSKIKDRIFYQEIPLEIGLKGNPSFYESCIRPKEREMFYKEFDNLTFNELSDRYFKTDSLNVRRIKKVINFPRRVLGFIKRKVIKGV